MGSNNDSVTDSDNIMYIILNYYIIHELLIISISNKKLLVVIIIYGILLLDDCQRNPFVTSYKCSPLRILKFL